MNADHVLITGGAATALFIVATALLQAGDHLVVVRPNYATNLETPRAIGCEIEFIDLTFEEGYRIDPDAIAGAIKPETRLVSVTCPHNPTGTMMAEHELRRLVAITAERGCLLLVDETYRDLSYEWTLPIAASLGDHVISVASLSKAYGVPGIRVGWLINRDPRLYELFLAAKEQISICGSVVDEWIAEQVLVRKESLLQPTLAEMCHRRDLVEQWIASEAMLEWVRPAGGVVCFPRLRVDPQGGTDAFHQRLLSDYGAYVGPGHWFEMSDRNFRLGYGWTSREELRAGLSAISQALEQTRVEA